MTLAKALSTMKEMDPDVNYDGFNVNALLEKAVEKLPEKLIIGEFVNKSKRGYVEKYEEILDKAKEKLASSKA
jgi:hypothetical protein